MNLRKIFPFGTYGPPESVFKLIILAEGFTSETDFLNSCNGLVSLIFDTHPFSLTQMTPGWLGVYVYYEASANNGPAIDSTATAGRTVYESSLSTGTGLLSLNTSTVNTKLDDAYIDFEGDSFAVEELVEKGKINAGASGTLVVVLTPAVGGSGGQYEHNPAETDYYHIAVSQDGYWHQAVVRAMGTCLGLADEFDLDGADYLEPDENYQYGISIGALNLLYYDTAPTTVPDYTFRWFNRLSSIQQTAPLTVVPHPGDPDSADRTLASSATTEDEIKLYEGGGGFRTKVYRSSMDCLMRRRIGDSTLPVTTQEVPLCRVCADVIYGTIK